MTASASDRPRRSMLNAALGFFYPEVCQICGAARAAAADGYVCPRCWQRVRFITAPFCGRCGLPYEGDITTSFECSNCREMELHFRTARSVVAARDVVLEVIHRYKYQRALWFEPFLADLLIRGAVPELSREEWNMIVPVPLHPAREREREFNQAERLAKCLGMAARIPVNKHILQRVESTRSQTLLTRQQRAANVRHAFAVSQGRSGLEGARVVLVDDVLTTGATTSACAKALLSAGAGDVCVWTVARGL